MVVDAGAIAHLANLVSSPDQRLKVLLGNNKFSIPISLPLILSSEDSDGRFGFPCCIRILSLLEASVLCIESDSKALCRFG